MIETATACSADMGDHAVHHHMALLVGVEVLVKKMPQKTPALRNADRVNALHGSGCLRIIFEKGKKIAHRRESKPDNDGILCFVNDFVNLASLKSAVEMNEVSVGS